MALLSAIILPSIFRTGTLAAGLRRRKSASFLPIPLFDQLDLDPLLGQAQAHLAAERGQGVMKETVHRGNTPFSGISPSMPCPARNFQSSKHAARASSRMVAAPSLIRAARLRNAADGLLADRCFGLGNTAASRAACTALRPSGPTPK